MAELACGAIGRGAIGEEAVEGRAGAAHVRPEGAGGLPAQSPALRRYVAKLSAYVQQRGALFVDDTGDRAQALSWYEDGDHLSAQGRLHYTELFVTRLRQGLP